mgnify:CR=1 FL=1
MIHPVPTWDGCGLNCAAVIIKSNISRAELAERRGDQSSPYLCELEPWKEVKKNMSTTVIDGLLAISGLVAGVIMLVVSLESAPTPAASIDADAPMPKPLKEAA